MHAQILRRNADKRVVIEGHCDERVRASTTWFGERRANVVASFLTSAGVRSRQIESVSFGEERPADPGHTESARSQPPSSALLPIIHPYGLPAWQAVLVLPQTNGMGSASENGGVLVIPYPEHENACADWRGNSVLVFTGLCRSTSRRIPWPCIRAAADATNSAETPVPETTTPAQLSDDSSLSGLFYQLQVLQQEVQL